MALIKKIRMLFFSAVMGAALSFPINASTKSDTGYAYLYFFTIDGDDIESLEKKIHVGGSYTFKDPDDYKYNVYKDGDTVVRGENDDLYDTVNGIEWWDETNENSIKKYKKGDSVTFDSAGEYYFRVHTDNSAITGENLAIAREKDMVYLAFYDENMNAIESGEDEYIYDVRITTSDTYTFPDPKDVSDNGIYWACTSDNGSTTKSYLFKGGDKVRFNAGSYEFHIATDDPVEISYYYPFGTLIDEVAEPGDQYGQTLTARVGDTITLYKSPGAVVWGSTFKGWIDENAEDEKIYSGGASFKIMDNRTVHLTMVYEEDADWNPYAVDLNGDVSSRTLMNTSENVNAIGGTGYDTYIGDDGKLASKFTPKRVNSDTVLFGVPSTYEENDDFTSVEEGADKKDASSYTKDKYGYDRDESKITDPDLSDVLKQDNSAYMMDVYGNSMMYHSDLSRLDDMCVAWIRLYEMKNSVPSFATMIQDWDQEEINRFEAIEFALISQEYPGKENSLYKRFNSTTDEEVIAAKAKGEEFAPIATATLPEWKDTYMSETAFNMLKYTKTIFSGWADSYDDGVYEAYKNPNNPIHKVSDANKRDAGSVVKAAADAAEQKIAWLLARIKECFVITAHAEGNDLSAAKQYGSHITHSLDNETLVFRRHFFNRGKLSQYSAYSFGQLSGLSSSQLMTLQTVYNYLTTHGFSTAMAAGVCGNLWQECTFDYKLGLDGSSGGIGGAVGLIQWVDGRKTALMHYASSKGSSASNLETQLDYMMSELNQGYLSRINDYISEYTNGQTSATVTNVKIATDAWCAIFEGCVCNTKLGVHKTHSIDCAKASDGVSYQELGIRRSHAEQIYSALSFSSGDADAGNAILTPLTQYAMSLRTEISGIPYVWGGTDFSGFDCSGFVQHVLNMYGKRISRCSQDQAREGKEIPVNPAYMLPGDLCFYSRNNTYDDVYHVTLYVGNGLVVGAQSKKSGIRLVSWNYTPVFVVRRHFDADDYAITEISDGNEEEIEKNTADVQAVE